MENITHSFWIDGNDIIQWNEMELCYILFKMTLNWILVKKTTVILFVKKTTDLILCPLGLLPWYITFERE